jgi:hypothetical protein
MKINKTKNKGIMELIESVADTAKRERWPMMYDTLADAFYWTKSKIAGDAKLVQLSRETAFYITPSGETEGIFIQPFRNNFLTENRDVAGIADLFKKSGDGGMLTITKAQEEKIKPLIFGFSESIKKDIYRDALEAGYSPQDLQGMMETALKI